MSKSLVLELPRLCLTLPNNPLMSGSDVLAAVLAMAERALDHLRGSAPLGSFPRLAAVGRLRGTGRGIHFRDLVGRLEEDHPLELVSPFEDSHLVAGAVWKGHELLGPGTDAALAKLRWQAGADDLPLHVHDHSDRFIIVLNGRGFFHVSDQTAEGFDGIDVRSVPARERDVFMFSRGVVHTFSTLDEPMTLLSCQLPYLAFDDPDQFRIPKVRWTAREHPEARPPTVACDPAWTVLARDVWAERVTG